MSEFWRLTELVKRVYRYESNMEADYSTLGHICIFFGAVIYAVNFLNSETFFMQLLAYVIGTSLVLLPFILKRTDSKTELSYIYMVILNIVLTIYMIYGVNEGCSNYWVLLTTFTVLLVFGMPIGLVECAYFMTICIIFFWSPVRYDLPYPYSDKYCLTFPFLYFMAFLGSFAGNLFIKEYRLEQEIQDATLKVELREAIDEIDRAMIDSVAIISNLIDEKDVYTKEHSRRVARYSRLLAKRYGESRKEEDLDRIYNAALLHDIGKIGVPDSILKKGEALTDEEYEIMKKHTLWGAEILKGLEFVPEADIGARYHHERIDGRGYPNGVKGNDIPLTGRIISVADTFDAMNSERVYRKPCSREKILKVLKEGRGSQFDADLADIMIDLIEEGEIRILADRGE